MSRPAVFIGSATPNLVVAHAIQARFESDFLVTVWDQKIFRPSDYPIPSLLRTCEESDFAIQVLAADVVQKDRDGREIFAPNPNVLIELGMFMGALGQKRVFLLMPSAVSNLKLPSDLEGLTVVHYDGEREDHNWDAAVGPAAHKLRQEMQQQWSEIAHERAPWHRVSMFQDLDLQFRKLIREANEFQSCYIHSRRWRENYGDLLRQRFQSGELKKATFYLPDIRNEQFIRDLAERFDDAPAIPAMILDAFRWVDGFATEFGHQVDLLVFDKIPTYSFYIFQSVAIVSLYNLSRIRKPVPTIEARKGDEVWDYVMRDLNDFRKECAAISQTEIASIVKEFQSEL